MLDQPTALDDMTAPGVDEIVRQAEDVLHETQIRRTLRTEPPHATNVNRAGDATARNELGQRLRRVGLHVLPEAGTAEPKARGTQRTGRVDLSELAGEELIA